MNSYIEDSKQSVFVNYYHNIFPYRDIFEVLNISKRKELAFGKDEKTFMRYETFDTPELFYSRICQVTPYRIDVGATYKDRPNKGLKNEFVGKELVFDIDLTDYERKCCTGKQICENCYDIIKCAVEVMDFILSNEFGFTQYGFVFSGRRGVHCWVLGEDDLNPEMRSSIFRYFENVYKRNKLSKPYKEIISKYVPNNDEKEMIKWFPRLDKQVTVKTNHLIKMPFSIHPDTMKVSIPLDPQNIKEYKDLPSVNDFISKKENIENYVKVLRSWRKTEE